MTSQENLSPVFASHYTTLLNTNSIRVLIVDDHSGWRRFLSTELEKEPSLKITGEASDGLDAVEHAARVQPDLILLDISLPKLNGIEAARRIRVLSPASRILFVSENRSSEIVEAALNTGACGYVVKSDAARELLPALQAVLKNERFTSACVMSQSSSARSNAVLAPREERSATAGRHKCEFYPDDSSLVEGFAQYINDALEIGAAVTFVATESHRARVSDRLGADFLKRGGYTAVDVAETLSMLIGPDGRLDVPQCRKALSQLIAPWELQSAPAEHVRIAACGELAPVLLKEGKIEAALDIEHLTNEFAKTHNVDIFCGYSNSALPLNEGSSVLRRICLEHTDCRGAVAS